MKIAFESTALRPIFANPVHVDPAAVEVGVEDRDAVGRARAVLELVVRVSSITLLATCAVEVQTFWPCTR
jgi:hypothetical protein